MRVPSNQLSADEAYVATEQAMGPSLFSGWTKYLHAKELEREAKSGHVFKISPGESGKEIADGPRYKMLSDGWSVPQAEWLARRIMEVAL